MFGLGPIELFIVLLIPVTGLALLVFLVSLIVRFVKATEKIANKTS